MTLRYNCLRSYGHLKRMDNDRWSNKIMDYNVTGTYPRGRPKKRWLDNIKHDLSSLNLNEGNFVTELNGGMLSDHQHVCESVQPP